MKFRFLPAAFALLAVSLPLSAQNRPGISFSSLLNNVNYLPDKAKFSLGNQMQAVFVPSGQEGWVILRKGAEELYRWDFVTEEIQHPYTLIAVKKQVDLRTKEAVYGFTELKEPGEYVLDFFLSSGKFYTFPFTLRVVQTNDPFSLPEMRFLDGDWNDWAYLYYPQANPEQSLYWKVWMHHEKPEAPRADAKIDVKIIRKGDNKTVCMSRENVSSSLGWPWGRMEFDFIWPPEHKARYGEYFKAKDLLSSDGEYSVVMTMDGTRYGTWDFAVSGGKLVTVGRSRRGEADPLTFIEGGRDAFWFKRR